jgi:hypothetical protein
MAVRKVFPEAGLLPWSQAKCVKVTIDADTVIFEWGRVDIFVARKRRPRK